MIDKHDLFFSVLNYFYFIETNGQDTPKKLLIMLGEKIQNYADLVRQIRWGRVMSLNF